MEGVRQRKKEKDVSNPAKEERSPSRNTDSGLPTVSSLAFLLGFLILLKFIVTVNQRLPAALTLADEAEYPERFISERAEGDLLKLVAIGPKVTGSYECEVLAVNMLRAEIGAIAQSAHPAQLIQQDLQKPMGSFHMGLQPHGFQSIYENIQNIAIRLGPNPPSSHSVLVNCHFDSVPESPGASDNGLNCAVMLEVLRKLSRSSHPLKHNIIFLFNGAEENVLQAAHGFITKHHWSKEVRAVVNLDAAGAGGREILFQAAPDHPWLLQTYARAVPHPSASLAAQELFESGLIPSDTDYRIFRDFGPVPGIDLAHADNGYIYHTNLDTMDFIAPGVYQHTGDNLLALLQQLANASEVEDVAAASQPGAKLVYYDLFGTTMFIYSHVTGVILNVLAVFLAIVAVILNITSLSLSKKDGIVKSFVYSAMIASVSKLLGLVVISCLAVFLDWTGAALSWYARPQYIIPLYVVPYTAAALLPWLRYGDGGAKLALKYFSAGLLLNAGTLFSMTLFGIRSSYLLMLLVIFPSLAGIACYKVKSATTRLVVSVGSSVIGVCTFLSNGISMYFLLIPITGRFGSTVNSEFLVAILTYVVCFTVGNCLIPILLTVKRPSTVVTGLLVAHVATLVLVVFTSFGFPYSADAKAPALQRFYIYHTQQTLHGENGTVLYNDSGAFILPMDRNKLKYVAEEVPELKNVVPANCKDGLLCQFPLYNSRYVNPAKTSFWLPLPPPKITFPTSLELLEVTKVNDSTRSLQFKLTGPDHMTLVISPRAGVRLTKSTLGQELQSATDEQRDYYLVYYSNGHLYGYVSVFTLQLEAVGETQPGPWVDFSVVGHYQHQKPSYTTEFKSLLTRFPRWAHVTSWIATVEGLSF